MSKLQVRTCWVVLNKMIVSLWHGSAIPWLLNWISTLIRAGMFVFHDLIVCLHVVAIGSLNTGVFQQRMSNQKWQSFLCLIHVFAKCICSIETVCLKIWMHDSQKMQNVLFQLTCGSFENVLIKLPNVGYLVSCFLGRIYISNKTIIPSRKVFKKWFRRQITQ